MIEVPDHIWTATVATLRCVDAVMIARERVEATQGTPAGAAAIDRLGRRLADLEEAFDGLRIHTELAMKDI